MEIFNVWINILILIVDALILIVLIKDDRDMLKILKALSNKPNDIVPNTIDSDLHNKIDRRINELIKEMLDL